MSTEPTILDWLGISGLISLVASAVGFGKMQQRIDAHAAELERVKSDALTLTRLDERINHIRDDIAEIKENIRRVVTR